MNRRGIRDVGGSGARVIRRARRSNECGPCGFNEVLDLVVPDLAALADLEIDCLPDTCVEASVETLGCAEFMLDREGTETPDGITIIAAKTCPVGGAGRWLRTLETNPKFAYQESWTINATTGNDENDGSAGKPLKTAGEFYRRTLGLILKPASGSVVVTIQTDLPASDPVMFDLGVDSNTILQIQGLVTTVASGNFTATSNSDPAAAGGGKTFDVTAAVTWSSNIGKRIVTGPGFLAWVMKDLTGGKARVTDWGVNIGGSGFYLPVPGPAPTDPFSIQSIPTVSLGPCVLRATSTALAPTSRGYQIFQDLQFRDASNSVTLDGSASVAFGGFAGCSFLGFHTVDGSRNFTGYYNCSFQAGWQVRKGPSAFFLGGCIGTQPTISNSVSDEGTNIALYTLFERTNFDTSGSVTLFGPTGFFDADHGLGVSGEQSSDMNGGGQVTSLTAGFLGTGWVPLYGNGNAGPALLSAESAIVLNQATSGVPAASALPTLNDDLAFPVSFIPPGAPGLGPPRPPAVAAPQNAHHWDSATGTYSAATPFTWAALAAPPFLLPTDVYVLGLTTISNANAQQPSTGARILWTSYAS